MLKVLLVDDEPFIRQGIRILVEWEDEGYIIAGEASDGGQALEMILRNRYDLVLCDLNMPVMGGFELLEAVRNSGIEDINFAIVSGFGDFANAKKAMQYGCVDFLKKPVGREELLGVLRKVRNEREKQQKDEIEEKQRDKAMLERHILPLLAGKYDSINENYVRENMELRGKLRYINAELNMTDVIRLELDEQERRALQRKLYNTIVGFMGERSKHIFFDVNKYSDCYDVGFIYTEQLAEERGMTELEYIKWYHDNIKQGMGDTGCGVLLHIGGEVDGIGQISNSFSSATVAKLMTDFSVFEEKNEKKENEEADLLTEEQHRTMDSLLGAMERCDEPEIERLVSELYEEFASPDMRYDILRQNINYLMLNLIHEGIERNPGVNQDEMLRYLASTAFDTNFSRGSQSHFVSFCKEYAGYLSTAGTIQSDQSGNDVLAQVEKEISENYMNNISLKSLSEKLFINSAYLGQLFRKKYGKTFKEYLNEVRIEKAAELLRTTSMRVYQISEAVGYQSLDYFINKFVQIKKHTPTQYRKKII